MIFRRIGCLDGPVPDRRAAARAFWMEGYAGGLFLPFRDATNGHETYGAGRYLLTAPRARTSAAIRWAGTLQLDFNFAYQPSCAFDPRWACPLAPPENCSTFRSGPGNESPELGRPDRDELVRPRDCRTR